MPAAPPIEQWPQFIEILSKRKDFVIDISGQKDPPSKPNAVSVFQWERENPWVAPPEDKRKQLEEAQKEFHDIPFLQEMRWVAGGKYLMGDTFGEALDNEQPVKEEAVEGFYMMAYPITVEEFRQLVTEESYKTYAERTIKEIDTDSSSNEIRGSYIVQEANFVAGVTWENDIHGQGMARPDDPVVHIAWHDAQEYVTWIRKKTKIPFRLPEEWEWEYAARNRGKRCRYGQGKNTGDGINSGETGNRRLVGKSTTQAASGNELGIYHLGGNVLEYQATPYHPRSTMGNPQVVPQGYFGDGETRYTLRGGSWSTPLDFCRGPFRDHVFSVNPYFLSGFRLVF